MFGKRFSNINLKVHIFFSRKGQAYPLDESKLPLEQEAFGNLEILILLRENYILNLII